MLDLIRFIHKNPHRASDLYSLWGGVRSTGESIPEGVIHSACLHEILRLNAFEGTVNLTGAVGTLRSRDEIKQQSPVGLYETSSYLNHSCVPNTNRVFYGDFSMFYAIDNIAKGKKSRRCIFPPLKISAGN
jgi:hypothetical protein